MKETYKAKGTDISPYCNKLKMECTEFLPLKDPRKKQIPLPLAEAKRKSILWMMGHYTYVAPTPLWVGCNSKHQYRIYGIYPQSINRPHLMQL